MVEETIRQPRPTTCWTHFTSNTDAFLSCARRYVTRTVCVVQFSRAINSDILWLKLSKDWRTVTKGNATIGLP